MQVGKADPVPASSLKATQRKSGDRVRLPDLRICGPDLQSWCGLSHPFGLVAVLMTPALPTDRDPACFLCLLDSISLYLPEKPMVFALFSR